jgi:hypothetical protein
MKGRHYMDTVALLREQLKDAHALLEAVMEDVTPEAAHWIPPGTANPVGATYAHVVLTEDRIINGAIQRGTPLYDAAWAGKTGLSELMPIRGEAWKDYANWTRRLQVDLPALRAYAAAVYDASDAYLATLSPADLDRPRDLSGVGMGKVTLAWILSREVVGHVDNITGEISCLKGLQGQKGYPS